MINSSCTKHLLHKSQNGFTLIEIMIAVLILATALVVMLGLEKSNIVRTINDQNRKVALSLARKVMAAIDLEQITINIDEEKESKIIDFFNQNNIEYDNDDKKNYDKFSIVLKASSPTIAGIEQDNIIKLIELKILWGESYKEQLSIVRYTEHI